VNLVKGKGTVYPKAGRSFDPVLIPKAIREAGFTATEVEVVVDGTLASRDGALELDVPGLTHPFVLPGGAQAKSLQGHKNLVGRRIRVTGKLQMSHGNLPPTLTVEDVQPAI